MTADERDRRSSTLVLGKIVRILDCFSIDAPEPTFQEILRKTGLPSSTCQRLVQDLTNEGFLDRDGDRYRIGIALVRWAAPGTLGLNMVRVVQPILTRLRDQTGETACLYVRDGIHRTVVAVAQTRHVVIRPFMVGMVMPIHAGAPGKVFLAFDPEARTDLEKSGELTKFTSSTPDSMKVLDEQIATAREQGYATAFGERHPDVASISAPVFDHTRGLAAVIGLGFPTQRVTPEAVVNLVAPVLQAARDASEQLGFDGGPLPATVQTGHDPAGSA